MAGIHEGLRAEPGDSTQHLLDAIRSTALAGGPNNPGVALAPFAALLIKLADQATQTSQRLETLTVRLFWATVGILVVSALLLAREIVQLFIHG